MIDSQILTRWLAMLYEIDSQLSQLSDASTLEDRERLEEAISHLRLAEITLLKTNHLNPSNLRKSYLRLLPGGKSDSDIPF